MLQWNMGIPFLEQGVHTIKDTIRLLDFSICNIVLRRMWIWDTQ